MNIITTVEALQEMVEYYSSLPAFFFDIETWGESRGTPVLNDLLWISFAADCRCDVIPMGHPNGEYLRTDFPLLKSGLARVEKGLELRPQDYSKNQSKAVKVFGPPPLQLSRDVVIDALRPLLLGPALKVAHNVKFDSESLAKYLGAPVAGPYGDTMIASWAVDRGRTGSLSLDTCIKREINYTLVKGVGKRVEDFTFDEVANYSGLDSRWGWRLYRELRRQLDEPSLSGVAADYALQMDLIPVVIDMELTGAVIDTDLLETVYQDISKQIEVAKAQVWRAAGRVFNIGSPKEKQELLFGPKADGGQGLKPKIFTPKGKGKRPEDRELSDFAVSADALKAHTKNALAQALIDYSEIEKLMGTYVRPYRGGDKTRLTNGKNHTEHVDSLLINGRIHSRLNQIGAETGRFTSSEPNLQQVPGARTPNGRAIRNLFYAPDGYKLLNSDYSQIEPRIIASFSGDSRMLDVYAKGEDIYQAIAEYLGVDRAAGKVQILATAYGIGDKSNALTLGITQDEAKALRMKFNKEFPAIETLRRKTLSEARARQVPYVETVIGGRRYLPELNSNDEYLRSRGERQAFNTLIQGSAADIMKLALIKVHRLLPEGCKLFLTVHDEVLVMAPDHLVEQGAEAIKTGMETAFELRVPLVTEVKIIQRWGEVEK